MMKNKKSHKNKIPRKMKKAMDALLVYPDNGAIVIARWRGSRRYPTTKWVVRQMHRGFDGYLKATRVVLMNAQIVLDDHQCIPEEDRKPAEERKDYFKVQVRTEWFNGEKMEKYDTYYIVAAEDVGQAKERIARLLDIMKAEREKEATDDDPNTTRTIRKALPFEVDCIVPMEFSELYREEADI